MRALMVVLLIAVGAGPSMAAPDVEVLDAGTAPRRQVRFTPKVGTTRTMVMKTRMKLGLGMGGNAVQQQDIPETTTTMELRVTGVAPSGDISFDFIVKKAEVDPSGPPAAVQAMKAALAQMTGAVGKAVVTSTGITKSADLTLATSRPDPQLAEMLDGIKQNIRQLCAPLPEVAIGAGAKWRVKAEINLNGMKLTQAATYHLVEMKGDTLKATLKIEQNGANQTISKDGITIEVISSNGTGTGDQVIDLTSIVPAVANVTLTSRSAMKSSGMAMDVTVGIDLKLQSK